MGEWAVYKQCQTERSAARQREMEQGLLRLMLKKHYDEITVTDLCQELQIPRKAFYRYFSDKDGALQSLMDCALMDFDTFSSVNGIVHIKDSRIYMEKVLDYWIQNRQLLDALARSDLSGVLVHRAILYTQERDTMPYFMSSMDQKLRNYGTLFAVCGLMSMIVRWHSDGFEPNSRQLAQVAIRLLSEPLFSLGKE